MPTRPTGNAAEAKDYLDSVESRPEAWRRLGSSGGALLGPIFDSIKTQIKKNVDAMLSARGLSYKEKSRTINSMIDASFYRINKKISEVGVSNRDPSQKKERYYEFWANDVETEELSLLENRLRSICIEFGMPITCAADGARVMLAHQQRLKSTSSQSIKLPTEPAQYYVDRPPGENIIEFLIRVWGDYMNAGIMSRADLHKLDRKAYVALQNWLRTNEIPASIHLPLKSDINSQLLESPLPLAPDAALRVARMLEGRLRRLARKS